MDVSGKGIEKFRENIRPEIALFQLIHLLHELIGNKDVRRILKILQVKMNMGLHQVGILRYINGMTLLWTE